MPQFEGNASESKNISTLFKFFVLNYRYFGALYCLIFELNLIFFVFESSTFAIPQDIVPIVCYFLLKKSARFDY
jgi:hypothetical protein